MMAADVAVGKIELIHSGKEWPVIATYTRAPWKCRISEFQWKTRSRPRLKGMMDHLQER